MEQRLCKTNAKGLCTNCLINNLIVSECRSLKTCYCIGARHNSVLCPSDKKQLKLDERKSDKKSKSQEKERNIQQVNMEGKAESSVSSLYSNIEFSGTALPTAMLNILNQIIIWPSITI